MGPDPAGTFLIREWAVKSRSWSGPVRCLVATCAAVVLSGCFSTPTKPQTSLQLEGPDSSPATTVKPTAVTDTVSSDTTLPVLATTAITTTTPGIKSVGVGDGSTLNLPDLMDRVSTGVLRLSVTTCTGTSTGTGFLIAPDLVATVEHVVDGASRIMLAQGARDLGVGTVIGRDPKLDLALIQMDTPVKGFVFDLRNRNPRLGEEVAAIGFPLGLPLTVTRGIVSGLDRNVSIAGTLRKGLWQTDAAMNPGNSGGPVLDRNGEVIGLVDAGIQDANGIAYAQTARVAQSVFTQWRQGPQPEALVDCGSSRTASTTIAAQAVGSTSASSPVHVGQRFTIAYPVGWKIVADDVDKGAYFDTTIRSPDISLRFIRVDRTPDAGRFTLDEQLAQARSGFINRPDYKELRVENIKFRGYPAVIWAFEVDRDGGRVRVEDVFFADNTGTGWAVLTQAPAEEYANVADEFAQIRETFAIR